MLINKNRNSMLDDKKNSQIIYSDKFTELIKELKNLFNNNSNQ